MEPFPAWAANHYASKQRDGQRRKFAETLRLYAEASRQPTGREFSLGEDLAPQVGLEPTTLRLTAECSFFVEIVADSQSDALPEISGIRAISGASGRKLRRLPCHRRKPKSVKRIDILNALWNYHSRAFDGGGSLGIATIFSGSCVT